MGSDQRCPHPHVFGHFSFVTHLNFSVLECPEKSGRLREKLEVSTYQFDLNVTEERKKRNNVKTLTQ